MHAIRKKERERKKERKKRKEKKNKQAKTVNERKQVGRRQDGWKDGRKEGRNNLKTDEREGNLPQTRHSRGSDKESESVASVCFSGTR